MSRTAGTERYGLRGGGGPAGRRQAARAIAPVAALILMSVVFLGVPASASPAAGIVIHGPSGSSHLRLTVKGDSLVVDGFLNRRSQTGCSEGQHDVVCPLAGVDRIEIDMGPEDDKVEVLDPLPVPVTARLGAGSDKFIGNSEPDTCYPEATKRNRCYGGGGNDICITGQKNSDCVGDGGDDYCRHGAGSDGCWGDFSPSPTTPARAPRAMTSATWAPGRTAATGGPAMTASTAARRPTNSMADRATTTATGGPESAARTAARPVPVTEYESG